MIKVLIFIAVLIFPVKTFAIVLEEPAWVYKGKGDRYLRNGEVGMAIVEYKKAILKRKEEESGEYPEVHLALAGIYIKEELYDLALLHLQNAEQEKEALIIPHMIYDIWYLQADIYSRKGKINKIIEIYKRILKNDPNLDLYKTFDQRTYSLLKKMYVDEEYRKKFGKAYFEIGRIKVESGNYENAIPYLAMALVYRYNSKKSLETLVNCYIEMGNTNMADYVKNIFEQVNEKSP